MSKGVVRCQVCVCVVGPGNRAPEWALLLFRAGPKSPRGSVLLEESSRAQALMQVLYTHHLDRIPNTPSLNDFKVTQLEHDFSSDSFPVAIRPYPVLYSCYHSS